MPSHGPSTGIKFAATLEEHSSSRRVLVHNPRKRLDIQAPDGFFLVHHFAAFGRDQRGADALAAPHEFLVRGLTIGGRQNRPRRADDDREAVFDQPFPPGQDGLEGFGNTLARHCCRDISARSRIGSQLRRFGPGEALRERMMGLAFAGNHDLRRAAQRKVELDQLAHDTRE